MGMLYGWTNSAYVSGPYEAADWACRYPHAHRVPWTVQAGLGGVHKAGGFTRPVVLHHCPAEEVHELFEPFWAVVAVEEQIVHAPQAHRPLEGPVVQGVAVPAYGYEVAHQRIKLFGLPRHALRVMPELRGSQLREVIWVIQRRDWLVRSAGHAG